MRSGILFFFLLLTCIVSKSQNLVPNPSFENLKKPYDCGLTADRVQFEALVNDWIMPTSATPDIYTTLSPGDCQSHMPYTTFPANPHIPVGSQLPRTGNNFAGIVPFNWYREYLEIKLSSPLIPGEVYCCEMYVSRAENTTVAQNSIGMYFSDTLVQLGDAQPPLFFEAQIIGEEVIEDTVTWVKISGSFTATSPAQYLLIGNFTPIGRAQFTTPETPGPGKHGFTYYYIDDISVERLVPPPLVITGNHPVCPGDTLKMKASGWDNLRWVQVSNPHRILSWNDSVTVRPSTGVHSYMVQGTYCSHPLMQEVTVSLKPVPEIDLGKDTLICPGSVYVLDPGSGYSNFTWQDGSLLSTYAVSHAGTYTLKASNSDGCFDSTSITIGEYTAPVVSLGEDFETCNPSGELNAYTGRSYDNYTWQDGSDNSLYQFNNAGSYWVTVKNLCGAETSDTIHISRVTMFLPNLITPNSDGKNDEFEVLGIDPDKGSISVYNRNGVKVYHDSSYSNDWNGEGLTGDVYYYVWEYPYCEDRKGWIQVFK